MCHVARAGSLLVVVQATWYELLQTLNINNSYQGPHIKISPLFTVRPYTTQIDMDITQYQIRASTRPRSDFQRQCSTTYHSQSCQRKLDRSHGSYTRQAVRSITHHCTFTLEASSIFSLYWLHMSFMCFFLTQRVVLSL